LKNREKFCLSIVRPLGAKAVLARENFGNISYQQTPASCAKFCNQTITSFSALLAKTDVM